MTADDCNGYARCAGHAGCDGRWHLEWPHGSAQVQALGGMLGPLRLRLNPAHSIEVMHVAPWTDAPGSGALPGLLRRMRGEWPCLPFGRSDRPRGLPAGWTGTSAADHWDHGFAANHAWQLVDASAAHVHLAIDYPAQSAIARIERVVRADPASPALDMSLTVWARREARLPAGLHPVFRLPPDVRRARIMLGKHDGIFSYPTNTDGALARLRPDTRSDSLARMQGNTGTVDFSHLPLAGLSEDLMQVRALAGAGTRAPFALHYLDEQACVGLWWDTTQLPDLMLWVSNGGRRDFPWMSRNVALGAEPVNSLFDLGRVAAAPAGHPLASRLGVMLSPEQPWRTHYRIAAWPRAMAP